MVVLPPLGLIDVTWELGRSIMAPSVVSGAILVSSHDPSPVSKGPRLELCRVLNHIDHSTMERGGARGAPLTHAVPDPRSS